MRRVAAGTFRKWVLVGCGFTAGGYGAVFAATLATQGVVDPWVRVSEIVTILAALTGFGLAWRDRVDAAAVLVVVLLWAQTHAGIFVTGQLFRPGAFVLPGIVIASGLIFGPRAGWIFAISGSFTAVAAAALGAALGLGPGPWVGPQIAFAITLAAVLLAIAAVLHFSLDAFTRAVEEARESSARFERLVADAPDGILTLGPNGRILSANPRAMSIFERGTVRMVGEDFAGLFPPEGAEEVRRWLSWGARGTLQLRTHRRVLEATGRQIVATEDGSETQIILRDVSDRETASELAAELSRVIRETPAEIVFFQVADGSIVLTSRGLRDNLGFTGAELYGRRISEVSPGLEGEGLGELLRRLDRAPGHTVRVTGVHRRVDGSVYPIAAEYALGELGGEPVVIGFVTDRTEGEAAQREQFELQRQLQHAQKMEAVGHLAGGVAHDFNNLLTVIGGSAEVLREDVPAELYDLVDEIAQAQRRGQELIRRLLAFARREIAQPRVTRLDDLVASSLVLVRRLVGEKIRVTFEVVGTPPSTRVDPGQVEQVLMNLCANARDAMSEGGTLSLQVSGSEGGDAVRLSVSDTGVGMPPDVVGHIFEPFFTTKPVGAGTGLGLATVHGIVTQAGGTIRVDSMPGVGTRFLLDWPASEEAESESGEPDPIVPGERALEVLYVEDFPETRTLIARLLRRAGHTVHVAASAEEALALPPDTLRSVDLVVTDVVMPGISGIAMAEELKTLGIDVPVLFVSGYLDEGIHGTVPADGRHDLLLKPFTGKALNARIAGLMQMEWATTEAEASS